MNLQQIINSKVYLTYEQETSLESLLTFKQREHIRREIKNRLKYKFYTIFDGNEVSKQIVWENGMFSVTAKDNLASNKQLNKIREVILNS